MRLLELFSGTKSISKVAKTLDWDTLSLDIDSTHSPDLCMDILDWDETQYKPDHFDIIWASCPCEAYSTARTVAKISRDDAMEASDKLLAKTLQIIEYFGCTYCIENPATSGLWKRDVAAALTTVVTSYCCYGYAYRKDTKLASNIPLVLPRCLGKGKCPAMCGGRHKEHAQKGGGGSMPRYKSRDELHSIPQGLVCEICRQVNEHACGDRASLSAGA